MLKFILIACPSGRPSLVRLREVWLYLNNQFKIMSPDLQKIAKDTVSWSDEAVHRIKIMLRHVQDLRASHSTFISPGIQELVSMIDDKDENGALSDGAGDDTPAPIMDEGDDDEGDDPDSSGLED